MLPGIFPGAFPGGFPGLVTGELLQAAASSAPVGVGNLDLLKPWVQVWGVSFRPSSLGSFPSCSQSHG